MSLKNAAIRTLMLFACFPLSAGDVLAGDLERRDIPWTPGVMWRDSPLPATFPLVLKTRESTAYYIELRDIETGQSVLGAGVEGGGIFRVLTPPGRYALEIQYGLSGEDPRDDESEKHITVTPLVFEIEGADRRRGAVVTLAEDDIVEISRQDLCQRVTILPDSVQPRRMVSVDQPPRSPDKVLDDLLEPPEVNIRQVVCD